MSKYILTERAEQILRDLVVDKLTETSFRVQSSPPGDPSSIVRVISDHRFSDTPLRGTLGMLVRAGSTIEKSRWNREDVESLSRALFSAVGDEPTPERAFENTPLF